MKRASWILAMLLLGSLQTGFAASTKPYQYTTLESTDRYLIGEVVFDSVRTVQRLMDGQWVSDITLPGCSYSDRYLLPRLPVTGILLGIPAAGQAHFSILQEKSIVRQSGALRLAGKPVYAPGLNAEEEAALLPLQEIEGWYPSANAELAMDGFIRSQRIVQVQLNPVRYLHAQQMLHITRSLRFRIDFNINEKSAESTLARQTSPAAERLEFENMLQATLANYGEAKKWRGQAQTAPALARNAVAAAVTQLRIAVEYDGVYAISGRELEAAGLSLASISPQALAMYNRGKSVAIQVEGASDGRLDPDDRILFIGKHNSSNNHYFSQYSDLNIYFLQVDGTTGSRFAETDVSPAFPAADTLTHGDFSLHLEYDNLYERTLENSDLTLDRWYWGSASNDYDFSTPLPLDNALPHTPLRLKIDMLGLTHIYQANPDHHARFFINGQAVGDAIWDNQTQYTFDKTIDAPPIATTGNTLNIKLPLDLPGVNVDKILVNYIELGYSGKLIAQKDSIRFTLPPATMAPVRIEGFSSDRLYAFTEEGHLLKGFAIKREKSSYTCYLSLHATTSRKMYILGENRLSRVASITLDAPSALKNSAQSADYIIISHKDFINQAQRLAQRRNSEGMRTMVVDVQDIYDEFNFGIYDPNAIRDFIAYAYHHWSKPAPLYILLFGDTTHYMNKRSIVKGTGKKTFMPTFIPALMVFTGSWGMTSSDNAFVAVSGNDILPDLYVGRFPVSTVQQAENMVNKTLNYQDHSIIDSWRRNIAMVYADGSRFINDAEELINKYTPKRVWVNRLTTQPTSPYFGATQDLADMINRGQTLLNFIGHGGGGVYFDNELFQIEDIARLHNKNRYPLVFSLTCFVGHFDNPEMDSLGEELVLAVDKGAVAHFGSAGRATADGDYYLNIALFDAMYKENRRRVGEITTLGKILLIANTNGYWDQVRHFILLGDPALPYYLSAADVTVQPGKSAYRPGESIRVTGKAAHVQQGTVTVTLSNDRDSLLVSKEAVVQGGAYSCDLYTISEENIKAWKSQQGKAYIRVFARDDQNDAANVAEISINPIAAILVTMDPARPTHNDYLYFNITVDESSLGEMGGVKLVQMNITPDRKNWQRYNLVKQASGVWRTTEPVQQIEGATVQYQTLVTTGTNEQLVGDITTIQIGYRPDLSITPQSVKVGGQPTKISFIIRNTGDKASGVFAVTVTEGVNASSYQAIGHKMVITTIAGKRDTTMTIEWPDPTAGETKLWFQVDVDRQVTESNEGNNITLVVSRLVTESAGTGGALYLPDASGYLEIPPRSINQTVSLSWSQKWEAEQKRAAELSGLTPVKLKNATKPLLYRYKLSDSTLVLSKAIPIVAVVDASDTQIAELLKNNTLRIYAWNEASNTWHGLPSTIDAAQGTLRAYLPSAMKGFSLLASQDSDGPVIRVSISGQNYAPGDVVSSRPVFTVSCEDQSGFDVADSGLRLQLDGVEVPAEHYKLFQDADTRHVMTLTYSPQLAAGEHELMIEIRDINGNPASLQTLFRVEGTFSLASLANHPNPFQHETTIAFLLTETATEVEMMIYTVSGRLVRRVTMQGVTGYHEWDWDGSDEDGNQVANGVYYLRFTARNGEKKFERIEKMARLQ